MSIEEDRQLSEFYGREENRKFVQGLEGLSEVIRLKGEGVMKYEFALLKERAKQMVVKEYMESELKTLHQDRVDILNERERYLKVSELER